MGRTRTTVTMDADVLRAVKIRAAQRGTTDGQVIEEAVRNDLGLDLLERIWSRVEPMDEAAADKLAIEAQRWARRKARAQPEAVSK